jgi:copper chaperone CopZ
MPSVFSVEEVEKRIGEVPGVQSVTVNFAADTATARFDETQLEVTDIKSAVRQRGHDAYAPDESHASHAPSAAPPKFFKSAESTSTSDTPAAEVYADTAPLHTATPSIKSDAPQLHLQTMPNRTKLQHFETKACGM